MSIAKLWSRIAVLERYAAEQRQKLYRPRPVARDPWDAHLWLARITDYQAHRACEVYDGCTFYALTILAVEPYSMADIQCDRCLRLLSNPMVHTRHSALP